MGPCHRPRKIRNHTAKKRCSMGESLRDEANSVVIVRQRSVDWFRRSGLILLVCFSAVFFLYGFAPRYSQDPVYDVQNSRGYRQFSNDLTKAAADSKRTEVDVFTSALSFFFTILV